MNRKVHVRFGGRPSEKYLLRQLASGPPYAEEGLALCEVAIWIGNDGLAVEYAGQTLSRYDVSLSSKRTQRSAKRSLETVSNPRLFATRYGRSRFQPKLFSLEEYLGEGGWLKAIRLEDYAPRRPRRPLALQDVLFPYLDAL